MGFTLQSCVRSISFEPFERFMVDFTQMSLSVRRCAEPMNRVCRLKVKVNFQVHGIYPLQFPVRSISPEPFERFSLNSTKMFLFCETVCRTYGSRFMSQFKVMGFTLEVGVSYISPEPFESCSLNFTLIFLSVRRCAEAMTQLPRL